MTQYPTTRMRRLRKHPALRRMIRETDLSPRDFIYPLFICPGSGVNKPVGSMPGVAQWSIDHLVREAPRIAQEGVPAIMLFGIPQEKDEIGAVSWAEDGIIQQSLKALKAEAPQLLTIVDLCFCEYTSHGHCGVMRDIPGGGKDLDNDATLVNLAKQAVSLANAGADVIAPSGMVDGMIKGIREGLDSNGHCELPILSYAAKYASSYYGPFRDAAESAPAFGDRRSHQMDPGNADEALREVAIDLEEGADMVMVKPAMPYLDIVRRVKDKFAVPTAAYQVSGEYSMIVAAANNGWIDRQKVMLESLTCIKRAGADMILTYFAREAAALLR